MSETETEPEREGAAKYPKMEETTPTSIGKNINTDGVVLYITELQESLEASVRERDQAKQKLKDTLTSLNDSAHLNLARLQSAVNDQIGAFHETLEDTMGKLDDGDSADSKGISTMHISGSKTERTVRYRQYRKRESLLVTLLQQNHFTTIWNICVAFVILSMLGNIIENLFQGKEPVDLSLVERGFVGWRTVILIWIGMFALTWSLWLLLRRKCSFRVATAVYIPHLLLMAIVPAMISHNLLFGPGSAMIIALEAWRLCMKMHSFTYTRKFHPVDANKKKNDDYDATKGGKGAHDGMGNEAQRAGQSFVSIRDMFFATVLDSSEQRTAENFLYFLFAPTLLWRPVYPRHRTINWGRVLWFMGEFMGSILFFLVVLGGTLPNVKGDELDEWKIFFRASFNHILPATMCLLLGFYLVLHVWLNLWAELLRFADRQFYQDWWNAPNFSVFYRKWNGVVHDFLHEHIYQAVIDAGDDSSHEHLSAGRRAIKTRALLVTFALSAIVHEYALWASFGFVRPWLLIMFGGPGTIFALMPKPKKKYPRIEGITLWALLGIGCGILFVCYMNSWVHFHR